MYCTSLFVMTFVLEVAFAAFFAALWCFLLSGLSETPRCMRAEVGVFGEAAV